MTRDEAREFVLAYRRAVEASVWAEASEDWARGPADHDEAARNRAEAEKTIVVAEELLVDAVLKSSS